MSSELKVVQGAYAAFAAGDVGGVLGALAEEVRWTEAEGGPYGGLYVGPDAVLAGVFARIGADWDRFSAVPAEFVVQGATVVALGKYSGTYKATGKSFRAPFAHVWKLAGGKVVSFHQHTDTVVHNAPWGARARSAGPHLVSRSSSMDANFTGAALGEPDLTVAGFQLWVHGRQFPESADFYGGNWLRVTAHCGSAGADVWIQGAILMVTDIDRFGRGCEGMLRGEVQTVDLQPLEPELRISLHVVDTHGHLRAEVHITPDHLAQTHRFDFEIDQSYLPGIVRQCAAVVERYPVRRREG